MEKFKISVMQPVVVNVDVASEGLLCRSDNRERYKDCDDYNSVFCHHECEFGPKTELPLADKEVVSRDPDDAENVYPGEESIDSFGDFDNRENGK